MKFWITAKRVLFQGFFKIEELTIDHEAFSGERLQNVRREVFKRGEAVGVLLMDRTSRELIMVEQFRVGAAVAGEENPWLLELVAGIVEPGETLEDVASRECFEETGCTPFELFPIHSYWSSPGGSDEKIHLYGAYTDASDALEHAGLESEHEDIRVVKVSWEQAFEWLQAGKLNNAMTLIGIQWLMLNSSHLIAENRGKV